MSDEKAIVLKRKASSNTADNLTCICHFGHCSDIEVVPLSESQYETLREAVHVRQAQSSLGPRLDEICARFPFEFNELTHGCHRWCFKNFTNISRLRQNISVPPRSSSRNPSSGVVPSLFPSNECLFCRKEKKYTRGSTTSERLVQCLTKMAEKSIKDSAQAKNDFKLLRRVEGEDLIAKETKYHETCRRNYTKISTSKTSNVSAAVDDMNADQAGPSVGIDVRVAHADAFHYICEYVEDKIIAEGHVERMTMINEKYLERIKTLYPHVYNAAYPTCALKNKLIGHFGERLSFWLPQSRCKSELKFVASCTRLSEMPLQTSQLSSFHLEACPQPISTTSIA